LRERLAHSQGDAPPLQIVNAGRLAIAGRSAEEANAVALAYAAANVAGHADVIVTAYVNAHAAVAVVVSANVTVTPAVGGTRRPLVHFARCTGHGMCRTHSRRSASKIRPTLSVTRSSTM
jgi:hypothetical protein